MVEYCPESFGLFVVKIDAPIGVWCGADKLGADVAVVSDPPLCVIIEAGEQPVVSQSAFILRVKPSLDHDWYPIAQQCPYQVSVAVDTELGDIALITRKCHKFVWAHILVIGVGSEYGANVCLVERAVKETQNHRESGWSTIVPCLPFMTKAC